MSTRRHSALKLLPNKVHLLKVIPWILWIILIAVNIVAGQAPPPDPPGGYN
ncbi:MAG: hypothetical protein ACXAC8_13685 [Candidatus Hodarchaeales archaeon]|jgi:hypothetical protein